MKARTAPIDAARKGFDFREATSSALVSGHA
jgi:hypothetical protein